MTPDELTWKDGDETAIFSPVPSGWRYTLMRTPEGKLVAPNYWIGRGSKLLSTSLAPFAIDVPIQQDNGPYMWVNAPDAIWTGDNMLAMMCAIEALGLTPEVT